MSSNLPDGGIALVECDSGGRRQGRGATGTVEVFRILKRNGMVYSDRVPDLAVETLIAFTVQTGQRGGSVFTDTCR